MADNDEKMIVGYARVSTPTQKLERQIANLKAAYPNIVVIAETYSGKTEKELEYQQFSISPGQKVITKKHKNAIRYIKSNYKLFGGCLTATECMRITQITKSTFYRYINELKEDRQKGII